MFVSTLVASVVARNENCKDINIKNIFKEFIKFVEFACCANK